MRAALHGRLLRSGPFLLAMAVVLSSCGRRDEAGRHYEKGFALLERQQVEEAIAEFEKAVELKPDFEKAHYNLGIAYLMTNRQDAAAKQFRKTIELDPNFGHAYYNLGQLYILRGDRDSAIAELEKLLKVNPDFVDAYMRLGLCYKKKRDKERAAGYLREYIKRERRPGSEPVVAEVRSVLAEIEGRAPVTSDR